MRGYGGIGRHARFRFLCGLFAEMTELADVQDLGSCVERREGSSPFFRMDKEEGVKKVRPLILQTTILSDISLFYAESCDFFHIPFLFCPITEGEFVC